MFTRKRKILVLIAFIIVILAIYDMSYDFCKYEFVQAGEGKIKVTKDYLDDAELSSGKGYCFLENDNCIMLGVDLPDADVDSEILSKLGLSNEQIMRLNDINSKKELKDLFELNEKKIIDYSKVDKFSFQMYFFDFKSNGHIVQITIYRRDEKSLVHIIESEEGYFSWKELNEMTDPKY